jgi:hypothetical protein
MTPQEEALSVLSAQEQKFVELWAMKDLTGMPRYKCYMEAFECHHVAMRTAATYAWRLLREERVIEALRALQCETAKKHIASNEDIKSELSAILSGYGSQFVDVTSQETRPGEDGEYRVAYIVEDPDGIPTELLRFIKKFRPEPDGRYELEFNVISEAAKDRLRAAELLGKMQGGFVERVEHSGVVASVTANLPASDAPIEDFTKAYRAMLTEAQK